MPGYPIRTPWDHSSVDSSPRPIAASHVLHRLLVPRHPPSALDNLTTKMLASTVQFSTNDQPATHNPAPDQEKPAVYETKPRLAPKKQPPGCSFRTQQGAKHPQPAAPPHPPHPKNGAVLARRPLPARNSPVSPPNEHPDPPHADRRLLTTLQWKALLRKEVIQPHLPVRLPCYDFVPIASPTFDGSPPNGLGHRLRVLPTFVT
jgi:hypothetical protein